MKLILTLLLLFGGIYAVHLIYQWTVYLSHKVIFSPEAQNRRKLKKHLQGYSPLRKAVYLGDAKQIVELIKAGTKIDELNINKRTVLLELTSLPAQHTINPSMIELLLKLGANVNYQLKKDTAITGLYEYETPLINAVSSKKLGIIKILLAYSADPNAQIDSGHPLGRSSQPMYVLNLVSENSDDEKDQEIRKLLIEYGANKEYKLKT
jgi:ankyrin repeat protein